MRRSIPEEAKAQKTQMSAIRNLVMRQKITGGQGRNRTADAGLFRAAYRIVEVV